MNKDVLKHSVDVLKILYMVVAGLAIAKGLELFVTSESGPLQMGLATIATWSFWFFVIFITTVVRFVHGAMRHFDQSYIEEPHRVRLEIQPLWDFLGLAFEAFVFFMLAFSTGSYFRFIQYYLVLLIADCVWLCIITKGNKNYLWAGHSKHWIIANLIVLGSTGGPMSWLVTHGIKTVPTWLLSVFIGGIVAHTTMDYRLNWEFYFGRPFSKRRKEHIDDKTGLSITAGPPPKLETVFIAGAYTGENFNEIEEHIRLAESYSIELWNRGYKVFCPHLNTQHFEVKANAKEESYKDFDMRILQYCDAVFALPNWEESQGSRAEIEEAKRLDKPIYYSLEELPDKS